MRLKEFLENAAYLYLTDEKFQPVATSAGIRWDELPQFDSVNIIREYLVLRETRPHEVALDSCRRNARFLELCDLNLTEIPLDAQVLSYNFREHLLVHRYERLAETLAKNPENGKNLLREFEDAKASGVDYAAIGDLLPDALLNLNESVKTNTAKITLQGFEQLSDMIGGFNPGRLIIVTGETGFGKTNLGINLALSAAKTMRVAYANMEMVYDDIARRVMAILTGTPYSKLYSGGLDQNTLQVALKPVGQRFSITNGRTLSVPEIESWLRLLKRQQDIELAVIDYDQKLELPFSRHIPEWKSVQQAIIKLEDAAKELGISVLVLSQLNRDGEISASHRATFTAHTVLHFCEHETLGPIIQAKKNRHGKKGKAVTVKYDEECSRIYEDEVVAIESKKTPARKTLKGPYFEGQHGI